MNLLLDTHALLWWMADSPRLSEKERQVIADAENLVFVSSASVWEIAIKRAIGKLDIPENWSDCIADCGFKQLSISWEHASAVEQLPDLHRDPFDRLLIAQALCENLTLLTHDEQISGYDVKTFA